MTLRRHPKQQYHRLRVLSRRRFTRSRLLSGTATNVVKGR